MKQSRDDQRGSVSILILLLLSLIAAPLGFTACSTRLEEARARKAEAQVAIEQEITAQRRTDREIIEEKRRIEETKVELEATKGDNFIKRAIAQDVTRQSRMYALMQTAWPVLAIIALLALGVFTAWFFASPAGPYEMRRLRRDSPWG